MTRKIKQPTNQSSQRRYVYVMERTTSRTWRTLMSGRREVKIGVAVDSHRRKNEVDRDLPGRVRLVDEYLCNDANAVEAALHDRYSGNRFTPKNAGRASGRTEWFRLTTFQVSHLRRTLKRESLSPGVDLRVNIWVLIICFAVAGAAVLQVLKDYL